MRRGGRERESAEHGRSSRLRLQPRARSRTRSLRSLERSTSKRLSRSHRASPIRARIEARIDEGSFQRPRLRRSGSERRTPPVLDEERELEPPPLIEEASNGLASDGQPTPSPIRGPSPPSVFMSSGASTSAYDGRPIPSLVEGAPPLTPMPPTPSPRLSPPEPESKGTLLRFLLNCCGAGRTSEDYYESHWQGHQPLASPTWDIEPTESFGVGSNAGNGSVCDGVSGNNLRMMRRRQRRGIVSPRSGLEHEQTPALGGRGDDDIKFPGDVTDPHLVVRKKWEPDCENAAPDLPGTSPKPKGLIDWVWISGCAPGLA